MTNKGLNLTPHVVNNPVALIAFGIGGVLFSALLSIWIPLWLTILLIVVVVVGIAVAVFVLIKHPELRMEGEHLYNATRACYEPALRMPAACWRKRQTKATKCNPAKVAGSLS